jgi:hypothetical protein
MNPKALLKRFVITASVLACALQPAHADTMKPAWAVVPFNTILTGVTLPTGFTAGIVNSTYDWYTTNGAVRGVASNPVNGNVLVSDTSQNIRVLSSSGVYQYTLSKVGLATTGAVLNMVQVGVADDGVVYASNLSGALSPTVVAPNGFKIWRWQDDSNPAPVPLPDPFVPVAPALAWPILPPVTPENPFPVLPSGDPASGTNTQRWGDTMDVRGAGANTQLVFGARNTPVLAIFTTADGLAFTPHIVTYTGGANLGVAFGPDIPGYDDPATTAVTENLTLTSVFVKLTGSALRRVDIRTDTWAAVATTVYDGLSGRPTAIASTITAIATDPRRRYLTGVNGLPTSATTPTKSNAYGYEFGAGIIPSLIAPELTPPAAPSTEFFLTNVNANGIAAADAFTAAPGQTPGTNGIPLRSRLYLLNVNNAIVAFDIAPSLLPPTVVTAPASTTVIAGWKATFGVSAAGSLPLTYQWTKNGVDIPGATSASYGLDPVTVADDTAAFAVRITNPVTAITSAAATLTVQPRVDTPVMSLGYKLPVDTPARPYLTSTDTQRGIAHNPANDHLLIVNRTAIPGLPNPSVVLLNAATGAEIQDGGIVRTLLLTDPNNPGNDVINAAGGPNGGTFALSAIDCDDVGVVYACNLAAVGVTEQFKIYRWENDNATTPPAVAYGPSDIFGDRAGEHLKVRGSGLNTQILVGARNQEKFAILTTTDGLSFTPTVFSVPGARPAGSTTPSLSFFMCDFGAGNTIWAKTEAGKLLRIDFNLTTQAATISQTITANFPTGIGSIAVDPVKQILGGIHYLENPNNLRLYNYNNIGLPGSLLDQEFFSSDNSNGNGVGAVDIGNNRIYGLDTNNGLVVMNITYSPPVAPTVITPPASTTVIAGWKASFSVTAAGALPLTYQWTRNGVDIPGATSVSYVLDPVTVADNAAAFAVRITNTVTSVTSAAGTLTVQPRLDTPVLSLGYKLPVDTSTRPYLTSTDTQRGLAHNPANDHLLIVNRTVIPNLPNPSVVILDAATGTEIQDAGIVRTLLLNDLDPEVTPNDVINAAGGPNGGTFALSAIDCDAAGVIYACNLAAVGVTNQFKIYRWENDDAGTPPAVAYGPADLFGDRAGDHLKVRGSGVNTQILVGARNAEKFAILTTTDGLRFTPTVFSVAGAAASFFMCDFGAGNTIWAKTDGGKLLRVDFDLTTQQATIAQTITTANFPSGVGPIAIDPVKQLLGGIHTGENPNNLRLYNYNAIGQPGGLLDLEFFSSDNTNGNRVGAVDIGNNRIYALDTNNGLVVMNINYTLAETPVLTNLSRTGNDFSFTLTGTTGATYRIQSSPDMASWAENGTVTLTGGPSATVTRTVTDGRYFFRARP